MKTSSALQTVYSFFLGLAVVAFFGVGLATFYPVPNEPDDMDWEKYQPLYEQWSVYTSVSLLGFAVLVLVVALFWADKIAVLANGLLLGGLFTLFYAVMLTLDSSQSVFRFVMVAIALAIAIAVGWYRFAGPGSEKVGPRDTVGTAVTGTVRDAASSGSNEDLTDLAGRITRIEKRLDAAAGALGDSNGTS